MKPFDTDLQYGNWGIEVLRLQNFLEGLGYEDFVPTGFFGSKTLDAVKEFQRDNLITPQSGYFGPITRGRINMGMYTMNRENIYQTSLSLLGTDVTPDDIVPDEYDCADTICVLLKKAGFDIGDLPLTTDLYRKLTTAPMWRKTYKPIRGDVVISPTGFGTGTLLNGHVGIVGINEKIMSNSSSSGKFEENYTFSSWRKRYVNVGGFPMVFFRKL